jgi:spermidine synthase
MLKKKGRSSVDEQKADLRMSLAVVVMVFLSGFASLVYQVLWMRQLGFLFGNTAQAASVTLAAFFAGLGAGSWWWGRRVGASARPMRLYAGLELGIALAALAYFGVLHGFRAIYPFVYESVSAEAWLLCVKFGLAVILVFPASFFMGGTIPAIGQAMIRDRSRFGRTASLLYGINTLGAALGVLCAAFIWIPSYGFRTSYVLALLLSLGVGAWAWKLSGNRSSGLDQLGKQLEANPGTPVERTPLPGRLALGGLCFFSGFVVLALEVVWMRVFAQVHENSVYSYAVILAVVLVCLALGAGISSILSRFAKRPMLVLGVLTTAGGVLLVLGPIQLMHVTDGLKPVQDIEAWGDYVRGLIKMGFGGIGFVSILLGTVFPFLMKLAERDMRVPGQMLGKLLALNIAGAIGGSLVCGFIMLPIWGMWGTLQILSAVYLVVALLLPLGWKRSGIALRIVGAGALVMSFTLLDPSGLPVTAHSFRGKPAKVLEVWEESDCTVAVIESTSGHRAILVNSSYALGSTAAFEEQANQSRIPLYLFPETRSIFFLGMGTGISAGAALHGRFPNVERVVTCELTPAVVEASKKWFPAIMTGGLFNDPRSEVRIEDGRHFLMASDERFDMINADLFLPYRRGAGSLYSRDHYESVLESLNPEGVFVQWLPMYQLTEYEFGVIARTMLEVFDDVTMWRNNFVPGEEKVALIARRKAAPFPVPAEGNRDVMLGAVRGLHWSQTVPDMVRVERESMPFFYAGNLSESRALFKAYPVNTDNRPVIEYETPKLFREVAAKEAVIWCVGPKLAALIERIWETCPLDEDPSWGGHPESSLHLVKSGGAFHRSMIYKATGQRQDLEAAWATFIREWKLGAR